MLEYHWNQDGEFYQSTKAKKKNDQIEIQNQKNIMM